MYRLNEPTEIWIGTPTPTASLVIDDPVVSADDSVSVMLFDHSTNQSWQAEVLKLDGGVFGFCFTAEQTAGMTPDTDLTLEIYLQGGAGGDLAADAMPYERITNYAHAVNCSETHDNKQDEQ